MKSGLLVGVIAAGALAIFYVIYKHQQTVAAQENTLNYGEAISPGISVPTLATNLISDISGALQSLPKFNAAGAQQLADATALPLSATAGTSTTDNSLEDLSPYSPSLISSDFAPLPLEPSVAQSPSLMNYDFNPDDTTDASLYDPSQVDSEYETVES